jgi:exopolysaccharide biosynthesis polyprenyl glycosylphosphotransferase
MSLVNKLKIFLLFAGDIFALYLGLFAVLLLRYRSNFYNQFANNHFFPFLIIFALWIIIFYIAGLYEPKRLRNSLDFLKTLWLTIFINSVVAMLFFYLIPLFGIAPKTNLVLFVVIFAFVETIWRRLFNKIFSSGEAPNRVMLMGNTSATEEIFKTISSNPQLGYEIKARLLEGAANSAPQIFKETALKNKINLVVIPRHLKNNPKLTNVLYELLNRGVEIRDLTNFYELVERKVPIADLEETWFLENLINQQKFYDQLKRAWEFMAALILQIALLPLEIIIAIIIKITSRGNIIYKQIRVGKNERSFALYKFRTMRRDAEKDGARWADPNDARATTFGKFLRHTHLDELPQLINIMKDELSFVGPRPERPEFVEKLKEQIPYYEVRLLIKPGVTGWAQINYRKDLTPDDVKEKLQYDIYYIKNRSIILDMAIILKTIKSFFINPK